MMLCRLPRTGAPSVRCWPECALPGVTALWGGCRRRSAARPGGRARCSALGLVRRSALPCRSHVRSRRLSAARRAPTSGTSLPCEGPHARQRRSYLAARSYRPAWRYKVARAHNTSPVLGWRSPILRARSACALCSALSAVPTSPLLIAACPCCSSAAAVASCEVPKVASASATSLACIRVVSLAPGACKEQTSASSCSTRKRSTFILSLWPPSGPYLSSRSLRARRRGISAVADFRCRSCACASRYNSAGSTLWPCVSPTHTLSICRR
mmetsp:Transcript_6192/g.24805  ORF Transcript_6192/g.24805 Transcript_6192/m.24805 type:complete len:269 (-) Transcript_6192:382-1188(-)